jgi:hypothetical protein
MVRRRNDSNRIQSSEPDGGLEPDGQIGEDTIANFEKINEENG